MKILQNTLFLILLLWAPCASSQTFIYDSKVWSVLATGYFQGEEKWMKTTSLKFNQDTIINGTVYRKLYESQDEARQNWKFKTLFRETTDKKVYHREPYTGWESLIYDFGLQENDTFKVWEGLNLVVDSIRIKKWGEKERKIWYLKAPGFEFLPQKTIWVEGVGQLGHFIWSTEVDIQGAKRELLCFEEDGQQVYQNPFYNECYISEGFDRLIEVDAGKDTTYCVGLYPDTMFLGNNLRIENAVGPYSVKWECRYEVTPTFIFSASDFLNDTTTISPYFSDWITSPAWIKFIVHVTDSLGNYAKDSLNVRFSTFAYLTGYNVIEVEKGDSILFSQASVGGGIEPLSFHWQPAIGLTNPDTLVTWCKTDSLTQWRNEYNIIATDSCGCVSSPNLAYEVRVLPTAVNDKNLGIDRLNIRQKGTRVFFNNPYRQRSRVTLVSLDGKILSAFEITNDNFEITSLLKTKDMYILKISVGEITESKMIVNY